MVPSWILMGFWGVSHGAMWGLWVPHGAMWVWVPSGHGRRIGRGTLRAWGSLMVLFGSGSPPGVVRRAFGLLMVLLESLGPSWCHTGLFTPFVVPFGVPSWCHAGSLGLPWHGVRSLGQSRKFATDQGDHWSVSNFCDKSPLARSPCSSSHLRSLMLLDAGFPPAQTS